MPADYLVPWLNASGQGGLRNSMLVAAGDGTTLTYSFNFAGGYISKDHIKAYTFDPTTGTTTPVTITPGMWTGASQITLASPVTVGQYIVIYRDTPKGAPLVSFTDGAILNEPNLDEMAEQAVFAAAEMVDRFDTVNDGSTLAIQNAATALSQSNAALAQSASAVSTANAANTTAAEAHSEASSAVSTANAANATANGIDAKAQSALDNSSAAVATANSAETVANGIDAKAQTALDNSNSAVSIASSANTTANNAASTANGIDAKATQAQSDAASAVTAASNAVTTANAAMQKSANLGDVANKTSARSNLGTQGKILLSEVVLTGVATSTGGVDFDGLFTSEFYAYEIEIDGWRCSADTGHSCFLRWKRSGSVVATNGYSYAWQWNNTNPATSVVGAANQVLVQLLNGQAGELGDISRGQSGRIRLSNPLNTTTSKHITWEIMGINGPGSLACYRGGGYWAADTNSFSGVQIAKDSGVQTTYGRFRLYGIR